MKMARQEGIGVSDVHAIAHELALRADITGITSVEEARAWIEAEWADWRQRVAPQMLESVAVALYRQCNPIAPAGMGRGTAGDG